jgi:hypothetical protein
MPQSLYSLKDKVLAVLYRYSSTVPSISPINTAVAVLHNASAALIFEIQGTGCSVEV